MNNEVITASPQGRRAKLGVKHRASGILSQPTVVKADEIRKGNLTTSSKNPWNEKEINHFN